MQYIIYGYSIYPIAQNSQRKKQYPFEFSIFHWIFEAIALSLPLKQGLRQIYYILFGSHSELH